MTISEAIAIDTYLVKEQTIIYLPHHYAAIKLGIEALKEIKKRRPTVPWITPTILPGETKERR